MYKYYEIKVTIRESHPPIWRRSRIPANITFNDLAAIIEIAFEWCGYHLYEFEVEDTLHEMGQFIAVPSEDEYGYEEKKKVAKVIYDLNIDKFTRNHKVINEYKNKKKEERREERKANYLNYYLTKITNID